MQQDSHVDTSQPAVTVLEITEPTAVNAGLELVDQDAVPLEALPLRARRVIVRLDAATVVLQSTNRRLRTHTRVHAGRLAYVVFGKHSSGTVNGLALTPESLMAVEPDAEARFVVEAGWETVSFLVSPEDIRAHLAARGREREFHRPHGIEVLRADAARLCRTFDWGKRLATTAARRPEIFNCGVHERRAANAELFDRLLSVLGVAEHVEPTRRDRTRQAHSSVVALAEAHAMAHADDHLSVTDLCRATGVSERTLEYAFGEVLGVSPVAYLTRLRLHRVRQGLLAGTHTTTTVTTEALNWGFWHFGEFSRAYKDCFGELPSQTLRRTPVGAP
jgi:AraC-like DNA-binding protein